ncbi:MAG: aspartate aminotransferase family protein [Rhodospirillaceae bacterium]|jgi:glutamate-1-semialdehyde 2,1-aminomutase|nr:aspartate aminotransferase family protein [Rhodospirillaceae bacterium]MBT5665639.1 aspartate aminotransferase family protein [Rhodospirillaceae bacterium]MBT5812059.1 aspartate aminotransferase family protein [Rhodospirillaceae bacterium]
MMIERPVSAALYDRATAVMPGGNTRVTVYMKPHPYYAAHGKGCRITDADGVTRLDFTNNYNSLIHGHAHPDVIAAVRDQLERGTAFPMASETEIDLAEHLCARAPSFDHVRFCNSGSEAVMFALKAARAHTGKPKIAKCEGSYHGSYDFAEVSLDSTPATWGNADPKSVAYASGTPQSVLDEVVVIPFNKPVESERILRAHARNLACVLIDLMPNRGGLIPATPEFVAMLKRVRDDTGMLIVLDEVITMRLDYEGAQSLYDLRADLTALGKIVGGGFPVGAVAGSADVMAVFDPRQTKTPLPHSGTFNANPVTMVAGVTAMRLLTRDEIIRLGALGDRARDGVAAAMRAAGMPGQVTGMGSLFRIHVHDRPLSDYRSMLMTAAEKDVLGAIVEYMRDHGVFVNERGVCSLSTPMGEAEIDAFLDCFRDALAFVGGQTQAAD